PLVLSAIAAGKSAAFRSGGRRAQELTTSGRGEIDGLRVDEARPALSACRRVDGERIAVDMGDHAIGGDVSRIAVYIAGERERLRRRMRTRAEIDPVWLVRVNAEWTTR